MRQFKLKISNEAGQNIDFGKRLIGEVGRDITAVKVALGAIIAPEDLPNQQENLDLIDPNGWLDCTTGEEISPREAATFDKNMQLRLMKFQLDHQLLIISYLFHKFGVQEMINDSIDLGTYGRQFHDAIEGTWTRSSPTRVEYDDLSENSREMVRNKVALKVVDSVTNMFSAELGSLREATLAVLHGWAPQAQYGNESYYHLSPSEGSPSVIDIIPLALFDQYISGKLTQKPGIPGGVSEEYIEAPNIDINDPAHNVFRNNANDYESFKNSAPESYLWNLSDAFEYGSLHYIFRGQQPRNAESPRTSALYAATMQVLEAIPEEEESTTTIGLEETQSFIERAIQPDPLTDPDPFIVDSNRIGFFDIATLPNGNPFTFDNLNEWIAIKEDPETISRLEDLALRKVLEYYAKPDVWFLYKEREIVQEQYFIPGSSDMPQPSHSSVLPLDKAEEDRSKYWVLTTSEALRTSSVLDASAVQLFSDIEGQNANQPLIKFVEYRIPSLRPGDPYRVYFEINREKLDLIDVNSGYYIRAEEASTADTANGSSPTGTMTALAEQLTAVCEDVSPEMNQRRYEEYRALAAKNRREIVRRIRETTLEVHQSASAMHSLDIELGGTLGPMFDDTFGTNLGPFGQLDLSDGRYAQAVGSAVASVVSDLRTEAELAQIDAASRGNGTLVQPDPKQLLTLTINWQDLNHRLEIVKKDFKVAAKQANEEGFNFLPENFEPIEESKNLGKIITKIGKLIKDKYGSNKWPGFDASESFLSSTPVLSALAEADTEITVNFSFIDNPETGITEAILDRIVTANPEPIYDAGQWAQQEKKLPKEFSKHMAVGYLSQIRKMTGGIVPSQQVAEDPAGCKDFGAVKNGVAHLIKYTFGLKAARPTKTEAEAAWHEGWGDRNIKKPIGEWLKKTKKNNEDFLNPSNFNQQAALNLIGEPCTWPKIFKEFMNKVDLRMLLCDYLKCIGLPGVAIKAPSLNIPPVPRIKIFGWYVGFVLFLKNKWKEIIVRLLCTIIRLLLDFLSFPLCDQQYREAFGNAGNFSPIMKDALADALFGLPIKPGDEEKAKDFVDDAFRMLRGDEICRLLTGQPLDGAAMALLERISTSKGLDTSFTDRNDILEFFSVISGFVPSNFCEQLEGIENIVGAATCRDTTDRLERIRRRLEANDDVTEEEIAEALNMAAENLMDGETAMQALLDNGLATMMGDYIALGDDAALISALPDTVNRSIERTAKFTLERPKIAYLSALTSFVPGLSLSHTKLARAGDAGYNSLAVIKVEAALQNLLDYQKLSLLPDSGDPKSMDDRFKVLYQVFESETINGQSVHVHHKDLGDDSTIATGDRLTYSEFVNLDPTSNPSRLKAISYSKQIKGLERNPSFIHPFTGQQVNLTPSYGVDYVAPSDQDGNPIPLNRPYRGMEHHFGTTTGPFAVNCGPVEVEGLSACPDNPEFLPDNTEIRAGWDPDDHPRKFWQTLQSTWMDNNVPEFSAFRSLDSRQAKEMFLLNRVQELTDLIQAHLSDATGTQTNSEHMGIIREVFDESVERSLEEAGQKEQIDFGRNLALRMSTDLGPFKPSISLREYPSNTTNDAYIITLKDKFLFPNSTSEGKTFEYCDPVPLIYRSTSENEPMHPTGRVLDGDAKFLAKREVFSQHILNMMDRDLTKYDYTGFETPSDLDSLLEPLRGQSIESQVAHDESVYKLAFEGILESVFFKLRESPLFDEDWAQGLHGRLSGKYKSQDGCDVNKFNLNHFGILSFDEMIIDQIPDLVATEMSKPENQPQNLDYNDPGPVEKALQVAVLRGFVRICLLEIMLKGSIPYSVWDIEAIIGDQFFIDYINEYIYEQLSKNVSMKDYWAPIAEKIAGITGARPALRKVIQEEIYRSPTIPDLSKAIFANTNASHNYLDFLMREDNNIIPNVNIPSRYTKVENSDPNDVKPEFLQWTSQHVKNNAPFLSVEHYIKIDGPAANFSRLLPKPELAAQAVQGSLNSLTYTRPETDDPGANDALWDFDVGEELTIGDLLHADRDFRPFGAGAGNITNMLQNIPSGDLEPLTETAIMDDSHENKEIYHIDEIKTMMDRMNSQLEGLNHIAQAYGFDAEDVHRDDPAYLAAEVLRRTPARFIKRERKLFKLENNEAFDPRGALIKNLIRLDPNDYASTIDFTGENILNNLAPQAIRNSSIFEESSRFYIVPTDYWPIRKTLLPADWPAAIKQLATDNVFGIKPAVSYDSSRGPDLYTDQERDHQAKFFRGYSPQFGQSPHAGRAGTDMLDLDNLLPTRNDLVELKIPTGEDNEGTPRREVIFKNTFGVVDESTFNAVKNLIDDPKWHPEDDLEEIVNVETWLETVIDFTGDASLIFSNPGESMDKAIQNFASVSTTSKSAWEKLKEYLPNEEIEAIQTGTAADHASTLLVDGDGNVMPGRPMGYKPQVAVEGKPVASDVVSTIYEPLSDFGATTGGTGIARDLEEKISKALRENDYKVPLRLLITQVVINGTIKQVFCRVVIPTVMSSIRGDGFTHFHDDSSEERARWLDIALTKIFDDYREMIENAHAFINGAPTATPKKQKYLEVKDHFKYVRMRNQNSFPVFLRQKNLEHNLEAAGARPSFCSVSKIYSLAAQLESEHNPGVFSTSQASLDDLFKENRGYLMKDTRQEIGNLPTHHREIIEKYKSSTGLDRIGVLNNQIQMIDHIRTELYKPLSPSGGSFAWDNSWLDLLPDWKTFSAPDENYRVEVTDRNWWGGAERPRRGQNAAFDSIYGLHDDFNMLKMYFDSMLRLFGGTAHVDLENAFANAFEDNEENLRPLINNTCKYIFDILDSMYPQGSDQQKWETIPEPFRSVASAGCYLWNGQRRDSGAELHAVEQNNSGGVNYTAFEDIPGVPATRITSIYETDLTDEEHQEFFKFVIKILINASRTVPEIFKEEFVRSRFLGFEEWDETHGGPNDILAVDPLTGETTVVESGLWEHNNQGVLTLKIINAVRHMYEIQQASLQEAFETGDEDFALLGDRIKENYKHATSTKMDQRFGLNYLYSYNLHDFLTPGTSFTTTGQEAGRRNTERCNKVALSISNILTWYSQKRSESFYGMTSHPKQVKITSNGVHVEGNAHSDLKEVEYAPLSSADRIKIPYHTETPGIMCGFSPFVGDGRYHIEEILEAYKEHFIGINEGVESSLRSTESDTTTGTPADNQWWAPKLNVFYSINKFLQEVQRHHFSEWHEGLSGHIADPIEELPPITSRSSRRRPWWAPPRSDEASGRIQYAAQVQQDFIMIPYRDFKYSSGDDPSAGNELYSLGLFDSPKEKYENMKFIINSYLTETQEMHDLPLRAHWENPGALNDRLTRFRGRGTLNTNFFIDTNLSETQKHLLRPNMPTLRSSGYPEMDPSQKLFLYHPARNLKILDHIDTVLRRPSLELEELTPSIIKYQQPWSFYAGGFGKGQLERSLSAIFGQILVAGNMLQQQWQCMMEDTGLGFFYENQRRIYMEALFDSVNSDNLLSTSEIRDCSRLMLNIPSSYANDDDRGQVFRDFPRGSPMNRWLLALKRHFGGTDLTDSHRFTTLLGEERAYRVKKQDGGYTFVFPLAKFETGDQFSLQNFGGNTQALVDNYNNRKRLRTDSLLETQEAKTILEYIFPIRRYMALSSVYSTSILGGFNQVPNLFISTKASLATVLYLVSVNARERLDHLEDVAQSEFMKMAKENMLGAGDNATACFDFPFGDDMWEQFKEELWNLVKQIPSIILRGIADVLDPAYKEMKIHWNNCEIKHLRNSGLRSHMYGNGNKLVSGLVKGPEMSSGIPMLAPSQGGPRDPGNGAYVPIIPGAISDMGIAAGTIALFPFMPFGYKEMGKSILRTVSYVYKGPASLIDPTMAFKIPCLDIDEEFTEKWNHGKYGRYGHPLTPFTILALMTPEINAERKQKAENCAAKEQVDPPPCDDVE